MHYANLLLLLRIESIAFFLLFFCRYPLSADQNYYQLDITGSNLKLFVKSTQLNLTSTSKKKKKLYSSDLFDGISENSSSESCLQYSVIDPLLQACNKYLKDLDYSVTCYAGKIELKAMAVELRNEGITDKRLRYNANGTVLCNDIATKVLFF